MWCGARRRGGSGPDAGAVRAVRDAGGGGAPPCRTGARPTGAAPGEQAAQPQLGGDQVGEAVEGVGRGGVSGGGVPEGLPDDPGLDESRVRQEGCVEQGEEVRQRGAQAGVRCGGRGGVRGGAPAGREVVDAAAGEDGPQDVGARAGAYAEGFGEVAAGAYDLVVEEGRVEALAADLGGLFEDAVVGGVPGEGGAGAGLAGPVDGGEAAGCLVEAGGDVGEGLAGEPAGGGAGPGPGEGGEGGVDGAVVGGGRVAGAVRGGAGCGVVGAAWRAAAPRGPSASRAAAASRPVR